MKILVCIKQVPASQDVQVDPVTGTMKRQGMDAKMNPYDLVVIEKALQLKAAYGGEVHVVSMGPPQADAVLREALAMGADQATLVSDRAFGGSDVLATAKTLALTLRKVGAEADLFLFGHQTTDGDTAQVGPAVAALLNCPQVSLVRSIQNQGAVVEVEQKLGSLIQRATVKKPCLLTIDPHGITPRLPSYWRLRALKPEAVSLLTLADLDESAKAEVGILGSPTRVLRIFPPLRENQSHVLDGRAGNIGEQLVDQLVKAHLVERTIHG
jgi:electron transfer flavoprotein beta subunit